MTKATLSTAQRVALESLLAVVRDNEHQLLGSDPRNSQSLMAKVTPPLDGILRAILAALARCQKVGL
jgi:hypothetical protein